MFIEVHRMSSGKKEALLLNTEAISYVEDGPGKPIGSVIYLRSPWIFSKVDKPVTCLEVIESYDKMKTFLAPSASA